MRKWLAPAAALAIVAVVPATVWAVTLNNGTPLDHQRARVRSAEVSTSDTGWTAVPGLGQLDVCAVGQVSATLSVVQSGAAADFRVGVDGGPVMRPRFARFDPGGGMNGFSFTFVFRAGTFEGSDGHLFAVEWRSPSGAATTLKRGDVNLLFHRGRC
jgi:hypothetical protein